MRTMPVFSQAPPHFAFVISLLTQCVCVLLPVPPIESAEEDP